MPVPWNKGKPMSDEQKKKLSEIKKGKPIPHLKGYHHNEETRKKMSKSHMGLTSWNKGKEWCIKKSRSEESRKRQSQIMIERNRKPSKEVWQKSRVGIKTEKRIISEITPKYDFIYKAESVCDAIAIKGNKIYFIEIKTGESKLQKPQRRLKLYLRDKNDPNISYEVIRE